MNRPDLKNALAAAAVALVIAGPVAAQQPKIAPAPFIPAYGQAVSLQLSNTQWPTYAPVTRYSRNGSSFTIEYEAVSNNFDSGSSAFVMPPLQLGELPPGNYSVTARVFDMMNPTLPPQEVVSQFAVTPPDAWGVYTVPRYPDAFQPTHVTIRSAAYFDASTMKATVSGNVIRVEFDYAPDAPATGTTPAGLTTFASVEVGKLHPGGYKVEAWGRPRGGNAYERYFVRDVSVDNTVVVHEYYHADLNHYFVAAGPDEVARLDAGGAPGWKRTGQAFRAWLRAADAPTGARPVCRFFSQGAASHFYTADATECQTLKNLEAAGRADALKNAGKFWGWAYEGIAFHALVPVDGQCPGGTDPVARAFNNRVAQNDANHRFMADSQTRSSMLSWVDEGVAFCSPR
jgi:hypothetical protein